MTVIASLVLLAGCGKNRAVYQAYEEAKAAALADPGAAPASWKPDLAVWLSPPLLDEVITRVLEKRGRFKGDVQVPAITLKPVASVDDLALKQSDACPTCLAIDLDLSGNVDWDAKLLGKGKVPFEARVAFDAEFQTTRGDDGIWSVTVKPRDVRSASVTVDKWNGAVKNIAEAPLKKWLDDQVVSKIQPVEVSRFGMDDVPLRALRVTSRGQGIVVEMLSSVARPGQVQVPSKLDRQGFQAFVAPQTAIGFAAAHTFAAGPMDYDLVPEPRGLTVDKQRFELDLRLWKVGGKGWWRDYRAVGKLGIRHDAVKLVADDVSEVAQSKGAAMADPLFFLGEGIVATEMEKAMRVSAPTMLQERAAGAGTITKVTSVRGVAGMLEVSGTVEFLGAVEVEQGGIRRPGKR